MAKKDINNKNVDESLNIETIANKIFQDVYDQAHTATHCIKCQSDKISIIDDAAYLYKCHDCKVSFSPRINSLYQKVRLTNDKWIKLLIAMISDYTLEETVKFVQSNAEVIKRKWLVVYEGIDWNKYNLLVREKPTKNIYADFEIIIN